ncbi:PREDICTED: uncharacterized protein LOC106113960, partial [Papilio xuthus]|uniref:Uncharacterized protein LOC106113960 n=1 Tax=Papilio xuthus TaxID=66420 RepID=A0AAJ6Z073_PAPXU
MATIRFLQCNINHCARAQDLLAQTMAQWLINVAVVADPYVIPSRDDWAGDVGNLVAISVPARDGSPPLRKVARGTGSVLVVVGGVAIVGVYFPPSWPLADFERALAEVQALTARVSHLPVIVAGDFNAKSTASGSPATSPRGEELEDWAAASGLMLLNRGRELTC